MTAAASTASFDGPRGTRPQERDAVVGLVDQVFRVFRGMPPEMGRLFAHVYAPENLANVMSVWDGDRPVAVASLWVNEVEAGPARLRVGGIHGVGTDPAYREHGLGAAVMRACHERMKSLNCHLGLLGTGIPNWYRKLGWELAGEIWHFELNRSNARLLPAAGSRDAVEPAAAVSGMGDQALEEAIHLQRQDRLGGVRTADLLRRLAAARHEPQMVRLRRGGVLAAWIMLCGREVQEWAGPAAEVAALLRACHESLDSPSQSTSRRDDQNQVLLKDQLTVHAPARGHGLADMLWRLGFPGRRGYDGMILLVDPRSILDAFGIRDIGVDDAGESVAIRHAAGAAKLTRHEATKLFFGPERIAAVPDARFPLPFWQRRIEHV